MVLRRRDPAPGGRATATGALGRRPPPARRPGRCTASGHVPRVDAEEVGVAQPAGERPGDAQRRRALRRARTGATGLLLAAALVFLVTDDASGVEGYVHAAAEAAVVGALADWFAVVALFRHPLGLPIPHTALVRRRKDALGEGLRDFLSDNFLTPELVGEKVLAAGPSRLLATWAREGDRVDVLVAEAARGLATGLDRLPPEELEALGTGELLRRLAEQPWAPAAGALLERLVSTGVHVPLVQLLLDRGVAWLETEEDRVVALVLEQAPEWTPRWLDERVAERAHGEALRVVRGWRDSPQGEVRTAVTRFLADLATDLQSDTETQARAERWKADLLASADVAAAAARVWEAGRTALVAALREDGSALWLRARTEVDALLDRVLSDDELADRVDRLLARAAGDVVARYGAQAASLVSETVARWDPEEASRRIELHVGRDLQFVRVNGTVVGALAGTVLHTVSVALG